MIEDMPPLVEHAYCIAEEIRPGILQCSTHGTWVTVLTSIAAWFFLLGGLGMLVLFIVNSNGLESPYQMLSFPLVFGMSAFLFWHVHLRKTEMGTFQIDRNAKQVVVERTGQSYAFGEVELIEASWDWAGPSRLDKFLAVPYWLKMTMKDGSRHRIGHGSKEEVTRIEEWLRDAGL